MSKSICVFCGARMGNNPAFEQAARDLGDILAKNTWRLVYGAGDIGLMGTVANSAQAAGSTTFGVIPEHLMQTEVGKRDVDRFIITDDMHSRKKLMFINSDAVVLLPGGAGSLDEFFEVLTWAQLGLHNRPIIVANIEAIGNRCSRCSITSSPRDSPMPICGAYFAWLKRWMKSSPSCALP